jgi:hypothetical protein
VNIEKLNDLTVVETIKDGISIYKAGEQPKLGALPQLPALAANSTGEQPEPPLPRTRAAKRRPFQAPGVSPVSRRR